METYHGLEPLVLMGLEPIRDNGTFYNKSNSIKSDNIHTIFIIVSNFVKVCYNVVNIRIFQKRRPILEACPVLYKRIEHKLC